MLPLQTVEYIEAVCPLVRLQHLVSIKLRKIDTVTRVARQHHTI